MGRMLLPGGLASSLLVEGFMAERSAGQQLQSGNKPRVWINLLLFVSSSSVRSYTSVI